MCVCVKSWINVRIIVACINDTVFELFEIPLLKYWKGIRQKKKKKKKTRRKNGYFLN